MSNELLPKPPKLLEDTLDEVKVLELLLVTVTVLVDVDVEVFDEVVLDCYWDDPELVVLCELLFSTADELSCCWFVDDYVSDLRSVDDYGNFGLASV